MAHGRITLAERALVAAAFVAAVQSWRAHHHRTALAEALAGTAGAVTLPRAQRRKAALDQLDFDGLDTTLRSQLGPHLSRIYTDSWDDTFAAANHRGTVQPATPDPTPLVVQRAEQLVASSYQAAQAAVDAAVDLDPWAGAGLLVTIAGLNRPQVRSVIAYRDGLIQPPLPTVEPPPDEPPARLIDVDIVDRRTVRFSLTKLRRRGTLVGWYEPANAVQTGRLDAWRYFGDRGGFDAVRADGMVPMRQWVCGDKPCEECKAMAGKRIGVFDLFDGGEPPRHPSCRCDTTMIEVPAHRTAA